MVFVTLRERLLLPWFRTTDLAKTARFMRTFAAGKEVAAGSLNAHLELLQKLIKIVTKSLRNFNRRLLFPIWRFFVFFPFKPQEDCCGLLRILCAAKKKASNITTAKHLKVKSCGRWNCNEAHSLPFASSAKFSGEFPFNIPTVRFDYELAFSCLRKW